MQYILLDSPSKIKQSNLLLRDIYRPSMGRKQREFLWLNNDLIHKIIVRSHV